MIHALDMEFEMGALVYLDLGYSPGEALDFLLENLLEEPFELQKHLSQCLCEAIDALDCIAYARPPKAIRPSRYRPTATASMTTTRAYGRGFCPETIRTWCLESLASSASPRRTRLAV